MRTTIVPAQVTTIEDKIAGNLGILQLLLITMPIFGGSILFVVLPPFFSYATYKLVLVVCFAVLCGVLAIRIKGKILLLWCVVIVRYNLRPRYYVFDRNSTYLRDTNQDMDQIETNEETQSQPVTRNPPPRLSTAELVQAETIIANPDANLYLKTNRKGELSVHFTEVQ